MTEPARLRLTRETVIVGPAHCAGSNLYYTNIFLAMLESGDPEGQSTALAALSNKAHDPATNRAVRTCLEAFRAAATNMPEKLQTQLERTIAVYDAAWPAPQADAA